MDTVTLERLDEEQRVFARWLRRVMRLRQIPFSSLRAAMKMDSRDFNRWLKDESMSGTPSVPDDETCRELAQLLGVRSEDVLEIAATARAAIEEARVVRERR